MKFTRLLPIIGAVAVAVAATAVGVGAQDQAPAEDASAPPRSDEAAYTQHFVRQAIERYDAEGSDATLEYYNSPDSMDGQWYVFIVNADGTLIANANRPDLLGTSSAARLDLFGKSYGQEIVAATEEGRWVDYFFHHPGTDRPQQKHSWIVRHDDLYFGSGWYEVDDTGAPPAAAGRAYARYLVAEAIDRYDTEGRDATLDYHNSPEAIDGEWYVFVRGSDGVSLANANRPDIVGTDRSNATDVTGKNYGQEILAATAEGNWVDYHFRNPETGEDVQKHSWVVRRDDLIFGSGWYPSGEVPEQSDVAAYTQHLVIEAIERYEADGRDAVIEYYNNPDTVDGQWYVFIDHPDGTILSHPANPDLVGTDLSGFTDVNGKLFGPEILAAGTGGRWVDYYSTDPSDGTDRLKYSWVIRYDDLLFGSGWYQGPAASDADEGDGNMDDGDMDDGDMGDGDMDDGDMGDGDMDDSDMGDDTTGDQPPEDPGPPEDTSTG